MKFIINNVVWRVLLVPPYHNKLKRTDGLYTLGSCDNKDKTIYVNKLFNYNMMRKVLCHEITHAAMFSYNILLTDNQEELLANLIANYGDEIINITNNMYKKIWE